MNARYYLPEIGRFVSADSIVSDPANPQSFNRYAYALNSPVNFTDPSGHCSGDPNDSENADAACWDLQSHLHLVYGLRFTGDWFLSELQVLELALQDLESRLGGLSYFLMTYSGVEMHRSKGTSTGPNDKSAEVKSQSKITFWDAAFTTNRSEGRWTVLHEFGHISDASELLELSYEMEEMAGGSSCLFELITGCKYRPGSASVSTYGRSNRREDFADSFAAYMFGGDWNELVDHPHSINTNAFTVAYEKIIIVAVQMKRLQQRMAPALQE